MKAKVQRISEKDYEKIFIMTDIHGRYDLFEKIFGEILQNEVISSLSYFDTDKDEKYYKVFLIGIFVALMNDYVRLSERESGYGRADLILEPKKKENPGYIFEFKVANSEEELESYAEEGFEQIKEKKYDTELINHGVTEIIYIGLAFYKKKLKMKYEKI